jgi:DNA-binding NarL/FixJ family response regulator
MNEDSKPWRLLVVDRDRATCEAVGKTIGIASDFRVSSFATSAREAKEKINMGRLDFVVISSHIDKAEVLEICRWLREMGPGDRLPVLITGLPDDEATILMYLENGASAFTLGEFTVEGLRLALRLLARGEALVSMRLTHLLIMRIGELAELVRDRGLDPSDITELTPRERDVLVLLDEELTNKDIARRLYVSEGTVKSHVHQILKKLKVDGRGDAVRVFRLHKATQDGTEG